MSEREREREREKERERERKRERKREKERERERERRIFTLFKLLGQTASWVCSEVIDKTQGQIRFPKRNEDIRRSVEPFSLLKRV